MAQSAQGRGRRASHKLSGEDGCWKAKVMKAGQCVHHGALADQKVRNRYLGVVCTPCVEGASRRAVYCSQQHGRAVQGGVGQVFRERDVC